MHQFKALIHGVCGYGYVILLKHINSCYKRLNATMTIKVTSFIILSYKIFVKSYKIC
jgi:hypothetical protein